MSKEGGKYLYHYTDQQGAQAIRDSGRINPSTDRQRDAALGIGVYLTDKPPQTSTTNLLRNNYDGASRDRSRVDQYVRIPKSELPNARCMDGDRNVCVVPGRSGIDLNDTKHKFGQRTPKQ